MRKYKLKKGVAPLPPKKSKKADLRRYSSLFLSIGLASMIWLAFYGLTHKTYDYHTSNSNTTSSTIVVTSPQSPVDGDEGVINILSLSVEQIEGLANTIAGQNAIWPGYKGDPKDHRAVQRHFNENFAKLINSGIINVQPEWSGKSVAFAYAVDNNGVITFVGKIPGGNLKDNSAYVTVKLGIDGSIIVTPAQDEGGENIIMLYYIKVRFAVA